MSDYKLLPCPFCGKEARVYAKQNEEVRYDSRGWTVIVRPPLKSVGCEMCGYKLPFNDDIKEAVTAWNTRDQLSRQKGE